GSGVDAMISYVLGDPPRSHAEDQPPAAQQVQCRHLLSRVNDITLRKEGNSGSERYRACNRSCRRERGERIQLPIEFARKITAERERRFAAGGDMGMLTGEKRVEGTIFRGNCQIRRVYRFIREHAGYTELHVILLSDPEISCGRGSSIAAG